MKKEFGKHDNAHLSSTDLEASFEAIGTKLASTIGDVLDSTPIRMVSPTEAARRLGVSQSIMSRVVNATKVNDPLLCIHKMPGPGPLRNILKKTKLMFGDDASLASALSTVDEYGCLVSECAEDRGGVDTLLSGWRPELRDKIDLQSRQLVHRGMSQLHGAVRETTAMFFFLNHRGGENHAVSGVEAVRGLRRLRPGVRLMDGASANEGEVLRFLDGKTVKSPRELYLEKYCTKPFAFTEIKIAETGSRYFTLSDELVGGRSGVNYAWGAQVVRSYSETNELRTAVSMPSKKWHIFVIAEKSPRAVAVPRVQLYDTIVSWDSTVDTGDPRWAGLLIGDSVEMATLPSGLSQFDAECGLHWADSLVKDVLGTLQTDVAACDFYHYTQDCPVYGTGAQISLEWGRG